MNIEAHPLSWPMPYSRNPRPRYARFQVSFVVARDHLLNELRLMSARNVVISSNVPLRRDGLPYANQGAVEDAGVAVYFERHGKAMCIPCDEWRTVGDNLRAIGKTVEAIRGIERWGTKSMVEAAMSGFAALPERATGPSWHTVLGVLPGADLATIEHAYRTRAKALHPDIGGGSREAFEALQAAYRQAVQAAAA